MSELPISDALQAALESPYADLDVSDALLASLRRHFDRPGLAYAEAPVPVLGGTESFVFAFRLAGAPADFAGPLVARLPRREPEPDSEAARADLGFEAAVQNALAQQGFPAPRALVVAADGSEVARPFLVMERVPGEAGPAGLFQGADSGALGLLLAVPRLVTVLPRLQAQALLDLHALDPEVVRRELAECEVSPERAGITAYLAGLEKDAVRTGHAGLRALVAWLRANRPPEPDQLSICHGDFHAFNLLFEPGRLCGVIDWTNTRLADPALDLAVVRAQLQISQLPVSGLPSRLVHGVQMRLLRAFEREYARGRRTDPQVTSWYEMLPCASAIARMLRDSHDPQREPLAELAWEHPNALRRLRRLVARVSGVALEGTPLDRHGR